MLATKLALANTPTPKQPRARASLLAKARGQTARTNQKVAGAIHLAQGNLLVGKAVAARDPPPRNVQSKRTDPNSARFISKASLKRATNAHSTRMGHASSMPRAPAQKVISDYLFIGIPALVTTSQQAP